jgi:hypothetical protein
MTESKKAALAALIIVTLAMLGPALAADEIWVAGTVTDSFELRTDDGQYLGIEPGARGRELFFEHVGRRVIVTGTLTEDDGYQRIEVESYQIIEE